MTETTFPRTLLDAPLEASFGSSAAAITELGSRSVSIASEAALTAGKRSWLTFRAGGGIFRIPAQVVSCRVDRSRSIATGRLHHRGELLLGDLSPAVQRELDELVQILRVDAPPQQMTEALQFEIVGF